MQERKQEESKIIVTMIRHKYVTSAYKKIHVLQLILLTYDGRAAHARARRKCGADGNLNAAT